MNNCCNLHDKILFACRNEDNYFFCKQNVVGIGLGYKIKRGFVTCNKCIKVFVSKKIPFNKLKKQDIIPKKYKGIQTDVIESGVFKTTKLKDRIRPTIGGYSIGPLNQDLSGTLGCLVTDGKDIFILSNNHILSELNHLPIGTIILQPSSQDSGVLKDGVATLSKYIPIEFMNLLHHPVNYVDCAIAKVINKSWVSPKIAFVGDIESTIIPVLNMKVLKVGRSTGINYGTITDICCSIKMDYPEIRKSAKFKEQIITNVVSKPGDSGGLLMDYTNNVVGLTMGATKTISIYNPIGLVLKNLKVKIVTN